MKKTLLLLLLIPSWSFSQAVPSSIPANSEYNTDTTDFFVGGNALNDSLGSINFLLCFISNTNPTDFLNKQKYVAMINEKSCDQARDTSGDSSKNQGSASSKKNASSTSNASKDAAGNSNGSNTNLTKTILEVTQVETTDPMTAKAWVTLPGEEMDMTASTGANHNMDPFDMFDKTVYLKYSQSANADPSTDANGAPKSKFGDFQVNFSFYADPSQVMLPGDGVGTMSIANVGTGIQVDTSVDGDTLAEKAQLANYNIGNGYMGASGNTITYKEVLFGGVDVTITYTATGSEGVYATNAGWGPNPSNNSEYGPIKKLYAFVINDAQKYYCTKLVAADFIKFTFDADGFEDGEAGEISAFSDSQLSSAGYDTSEKCYNSDTSQAKLDVYKYGVYRSDNGARYETTGGGFPLRAENPVSGKDDMHGWADYYGVWLDDYENTASNLEAATWTRDDGVSSTTEYKATQQNVEVIKFATSYSSLDSLDGIKLSFWVGDTIWATEYGSANMFNSTANNGGSECTYSDYQNVAKTACYEEYKGYWDQAGQKFVITHGMKWANASASPPSNPEVEISPNIEITGANWYSSMAQTLGCGESCTYTMRRGFWAWSPDTYESYDVSPAAINAPSSATSSAGIRKETVEVLKDFSSLPSNLFCIKDCIDASAFNASIKAAADLLADNDTSNDPSGPINSGFFANNTDCYTYSGSWECREGIIDDYKVTYTLNNGALYDTSVDPNNLMDIHGSGATSNTQASFATLSTNKSKSVANIFMEKSLQMKKASYNTGSGEDRSWDVSSLDWNVETGPLMIQTELDKLVCDKDSTDGYFPHNRYSGGALSAKRYCVNKIWQGAVSEYYKIGIRMRPSWVLKNKATNALITFSAPQYLKLTPSSWTTTQTTASGITTDDASKEYRIFYNGFGSYMNLPGSVYDICTGTDHGEYFFGNWDECKRWIPRFTIPDGAQLTDEDTSNTDTYIVKALAGDQLLTPITPKGETYTDLDRSKIEPPSVLVDVGPDGSSANDIGDFPTTGLLNSGNTCVNHGKTVTACTN